MNITSIKQTMKSNFINLVSTKKKSTYSGMFEHALKNFEKFIEEERVRDHKEIEEKFAGLA